MQGKNTKDLKVVIVAGESQVTNPKGFEQKGSLAKARAQQVEYIINKLGFNKVTTETVVGTTPYQKGDDANDPKVFRLAFTFC